VNSLAQTVNDTASAVATVTISGSPASSATVGSSYSFTPTASDSAGRALTFSVKNAPSWAGFNPTTGQLSGTPKLTDTGTTYNVVITAADGAVTASLPAFSIIVTNAPGSTTSGTATVSWAAPTQNTDGTPLTDLAGYKIYYGTSPTTLTAAQVVNLANPSASSYVISGLASGTWYFAVTSYSAAGDESALSTISSKTL
jgi:hypothetical protein